MTKTASAADVIYRQRRGASMKACLPAADRGFQRFFKAVEPKWDLKTDWQIISEIATRMGYPMHYNNTREIWDELRHLPGFLRCDFTRKWANWASFSGLAAILQMPIRDFLSV